MLVLAYMPFNVVVMRAVDPKAVGASLALVRLGTLIDGSIGSAAIVTSIARLFVAHFLAATLARHDPAPVRAIPLAGSQTLSACGAPVTNGSRVSSYNGKVEERSMMSFEASAAHRRLSDTLSAVTREREYVVRALADEVLRAYAAALDEDHTSELRWRAFFDRVARLADALEAVPEPPRTTVDELRALLRENEDILTLDLAAT